MTVNSLILVVDDEPETLQVIEMYLRSKGYEIIIASNADEALEQYQSRPQRPDLVLTDVVMPGVSGPMLAERLLAVNPDVRILFMSGYDDRQVVRRYVLERGFQLLTKPFNMKTLGSAVESALDDGKG